MVSANALKMQASVKHEWNLAHHGKLFGLVITYKSEIPTGSTNLKCTLKFNRV